MPIAKKKQSNVALIQVDFFDGSRSLVPDGMEILLRIRDGGQTEYPSKFLKKASIQLSVTCFDNFKDNYTILASSDDHRDAGFYPIKVNPELDVQVSLMLLAKDADFKFLDWTTLKKRYPDVSNFLNCAGDEPEINSHYQDLKSKKPAALASLLNLTAAMSVIHLPVGTPLEYFKRIEWEDSLAQDRFFGFADKGIVQQVKTAASQGLFAPEPHPDLFHGDATSSYKQLAFGEANVQLTFHERTVENIGGVDCVRVEPDIDYYKDLGAHALLEVIPNSLSHGLTDPKMVYVLRWIAGRHAGMAEFDPGYTLQ